MRLGYLSVVAVVAVAGACGFVSSAAQGDTTLQEPIAGVLVGVGPAQNSLIVRYNNAHISGCGILAVTPTATETQDGVAVSLEATEGVLPPGVSCADVGISGTVTVPLSAPLDGRAVTGVEVRFGAAMAYTVGLPALAGLSPHDARLMLTPPDGTPATGHPYGVIIRHTHHAGSGALPRVIAQTPAAGKPLRGQHTIVVLTVAP